MEAEDGILTGLRPGAIWAEMSTTDETEVRRLGFLKVVTNYLASANLVSLAEALVTAERVGTDLNITYEAIRISSGNSFVHETESHVILKEDHMGAEIVAPGFPAEMVDDEPEERGHEVRVG